MAGSLVYANAIRKVVGANGSFYELTEDGGDDTVSLSSWREVRQAVAPFFDLGALTFDDEFDLPLQHILAENDRMRAHLTPEVLDDLGSRDYHWLRRFCDLVRNWKYVYFVA